MEWRATMIASLISLWVALPVWGQPTDRWQGTLVRMRDNAAITSEEFAEDVKHENVVFLGEEHDNDAGHAWQISIIRALHSRGVPIAISLEMFERDVQGALNDYLAGRIREDDFLANARPWPNYRHHYRPIIEFARRHKIPVIAANVPRTLASQLARGETIESAPGAWRPRLTTTPQDQYWSNFTAIMKGHGDIGGSDGIARMYAAQCLKDDAMAEAIGDFLDTNRHRFILVVHLCGKFHSDWGLGAVERFVQRHQLARVTVVTMESVPSFEAFNADTIKSRAHYVIAVPPSKPRKKDQKDSNNL